jgi:ADP-ribosylglycohydrolase
MRAAILGLYAGHDIGLLRQLVRVSTCLTHSDPRAEEGALAVALAAREGLLRGPENLSAHHFLATVRQQLVGDELLHHLQVAEELLAEQAPLEEFAERLGLSGGVTGYINHTVPVAIFAWLRHPHDFRQAVEECVCLGGDTDTTGAIAGALAGATLGSEAIPPSWRAGIFEWPRSCKWIDALADRLATACEGNDTVPCPLFWPALLPRNAFFAAIVLTHGFRRLLPPY